MKKSIIKILSVLLITSLITGCFGGNGEDKNKNKDAVKSERTLIMLGTVVSMTAYGKNSNKALDEAYKEIGRIENLMSKNLSDTEVSQINDNAGKKAVKVSPKTLEVIERGLYYSNITKGAFDITIGPLVNLWDVLNQNPRVPSQDEVEENKSLVNYKDVIVDADSKTVYLNRENMLLDLGGIAKGYAADKAAVILRQYGIESAVLDLGGDVVLVGSKPDGTPWRIGVQDPRNPGSNYAGIITASNKTVVTSGDYERGFTKDGIRYHHIIDPATGFPTDNNVISVTIVSDIAMDADALSTAVFILGIEEGLKLIESLEGVDTIIIDNDKNIYLSSGLKDSFKLGGNGYKIVD